MSATKTFTPPLPSPPQHTNRHSPVEPPPDAATLSPSTLIEFPGRSARPQWRKELSLRVREIQERRARDGGQDFITAEYGTPSSRATNGLMPLYNGADNTDGKPSSLGLVPSTPPTPLNPIVARALERIERARRQSPHAATPASLHIAQTAHPLTSALEASTHHIDADSQDALPTDIPETDDIAKSFLDFSNENAVADAPEAAHTNTIDALSPTTTEEADAPNVIAVIVDASAARDTKESDKESKLATGQTSPSASGTNDSHKHATAQINSTPEASPSSVAATQTPAQAAPRVRVTTVVAASSSTKTIDAVSMPQATPRTPRRVVEGVIDEATLARREREAFQTEEAARRNSLDDRALLTSRILASVIDCLIVGFLLSPVAATVELSYGNWMDARVWYVMTSAAALLMFLYSSAATAFAGRTVGQRMLCVKPVEVSTGLSPSVSQAIKRAAFWVISFAALGLGLLYALLDSERRGIHDHLSGTIVVSE